MSKNKSNENELKSIFKYLLDFAKHPEQYNDDMVALLKVEQVIELLNYIDILNNQLQQEENIIKEVREYIEKHYDDYEEFIYGKEFKEKVLEILDKDITKKSDYNYEKVEKENKE